jgi:hypothetical protein
MARLYAVEDFPQPVTEELRRLGHNVRTVQEAGRAGQGIDDAEVLADATADQRAVLTHYHRDFKRLHRQGQPHEGIISCTQDPRVHRQATDTAKPRTPPSHVRHRLFSGIRASLA